ncbi:uncharacterized protein LOC123301063 [Chrysoperla carnea]|uniref:uncharacterized protein LOC123301063 n=1 Tax=Chrysoperla carnea TaxID=189513 RepID=UPI001D06FB95|nr:uncharacterized protein LOC123301063 [Chrysoperla carnea]
MYKYSLFMVFISVTYTIIKGRRIEDVVEEARTNFDNNSKAIDTLFQNIGTLQTCLYSIEKFIRDESLNTTNKLNKKHQDALELINKIDKDECRVNATKDLKFALNHTKTDINVTCQLQDTIELINDLKHDLKRTQESLKKLNKKNGETIQVCLNSTNQQAEELQKCLKAFNPNAFIRLFQVTLSTFNQITVKIIADAKKCGDDE